MSEVWAAGFFVKGVLKVTKKVSVHQILRSSRLSDSSFRRMYLFLNSTAPLRPFSLSILLFDFTSRSNRRLKLSFVPFTESSIL